MDWYKIVIARCMYRCVSPSIVLSFGVNELQLLHVMGTNTRHGLYIYIYIYIYIYHSNGLDS